MPNGTSGKTFGWTIPGLIKSSRLITSPKPGTTVLPLGVGVSLVVVLLDALAVVRGAAGDGAVELLDPLLSVSFAPVWAAGGGADSPAVGALNPSIGAGLNAGAGIAACVITDVVADVTSDWLIGLIGDVGFVTFVIDFTQLFDVVTQGCHTC
jgi:hypothetical protein